MTLQKVKIVVCGALHDEMPGKINNQCFNFCRSNAICTHGNESITEAIETGLEKGYLDSAQASNMLDTVETTQMNLGRWTDLISALRKSIREREPGMNHFEWECAAKRDTSVLADEAARESALDKDREVRTDILKKLLGHDVSLWRSAHKSEQLRIAQPILDILRTLQNLDLITLNTEAESIDSDALLALAELKRRR
jgi:hypothetical protein